MKINLSKSAIENCPSFDVCQNNKCPLHPDYKNLQTLEEDKNLHNFKKCRASKTKRMAIAKAFNLKNLGLTKKEFSSYQLSLSLKQGVNTLHAPENTIKSQGEKQEITPKTPTGEDNSKENREMKI